MSTRLRISEIFHSIQGESSRVGLPTVFVRLTGCPLRCVWCDSEYAFSGGEMLDTPEILAQVAAFNCPTVCVTGGEPLAQRQGCLELLRQLCDQNYAVSLETSGAIDISGVDARVMCIMDLKAPDSGEADKNLWQNLPSLRSKDEVKFVLASERDYQWAVDVVRKEDLSQRCTVLFAPVQGQLAPTTLAEWVLRDGLPVRFQLQLHKILWVRSVAADLKKLAVVLLSGGLDSATVLAMAQAQGFQCYCLSFDYGQRHRAELVAADRVAAALAAAAHRTLKLDLGQLGGSALTDTSIAVPTQGVSVGIPITYVPARNTIMLSLALAWAEVLGAADIFIGVNAVDYSGYPDCRPEFIRAYEVMANLATRVGVEGCAMHIHAPLISFSKADIIRAGTDLGVPYALTVSCYQADAQGSACGVCDSCRLRRDGFAAAGIADPTHYA